MEGGWIKLYWRTKDSIVYSNGSLFALWGHILLSAARKKQVLKNGNILQPGDCIVSMKEVAKWLKVHFNTASKYVSIMEEEGMIRVTKRDRNGTAISICNWGTYQYTHDVLCDEVMAQQKRNRNETETERKRNGCQTESPKSPKSPPPPPTPSTAESENDSSWLELEEEVFSRGVNASKAAVAAARGRGWGRDEVRTLLAEFDAAAGAYEAGALYGRLTGELAGWPQPARDHTRQQQREAAQLSQRKMAAANAKRVSEALESREQEQKLESTHGPKLDAMPRDQVVEMIREIFPKGPEFYIGKLPSKAPWKFTARVLLLDRLAGNGPKLQEQEQDA